MSAVFRDGFVWGAATAAYQIEGAVDADGRGESIWDRFSHTPGNVVRGETGDRACEHYVRWRDDVDLMHSLGLQSYRFSIAWPRVQPAGRGTANQKGIDFYRRLVESLLDRGIAPLATLYHWDLPQPLQDEGGWASREIVPRFAEYAELVFDALGDLVEDWVTHNEPWVTAFLGYAYGVKAPGIRDWPSALAASHHVLLSHGEAVKAFRSRGGGRIGITLDTTLAEPATDSPDDAAAARRLDGHRTRWFFDAVRRGSYPRDMLEHYEARFGRLDAIRDGDLEAIAQPVDFIGINFYCPNRVAAGTGDPALGLSMVDQDVERTAMGWPVVPAALTAVLLRLERDYGGIPFLITENGAAFDDVRDGGGAIVDDRRCAYLREHIAAMERARREGADVRGYYVWSLLDNFEWEYGYDKRFGIVYVDFATQERVPKESAIWYRNMIASRNGS